MSRPPLFTRLLRQWSYLTSYQKGFATFFVGLFVLLVLFPLIRIDYLNTTQIDTFRIFNGYMAKSATVITLTLLFLLLNNISTGFKHWLHRVFGFNSSTYLTNVGGLIIILIALLSIGDTVTLFKQNFSSRVSTTSRYLLIGIIVVLGLAWSLMIARIEHKKLSKSKDVHINHEEDDERYEPGFEQAKKEFDGLFGQEEVQEEQQE